MNPSHHSLNGGNKALAAGKQTVANFVNEHLIVNPQSICYFRMPEWGITNR